MICSVQRLNCIGYMKSLNFHSEDVHMKKANFQYYVEGQNEKALLNALKSELRCIESGKVDVFNVVQKQFTVTQIRPLKQNTIVILVYDTDVDNTDVFRQNMVFLKRQKAIREVICIPQVKNLEDELIRACHINDIRELTHSSTKTDYKRDLIRCSNLCARLIQCKFNITKFWSCVPRNKFSLWGNDAEKIKQ